MSRAFPILPPTRSAERVALDNSGVARDTIPWSLIEPHEAQALKNHNQTLQELAARGGLSACEALAVIEDREWRLEPFIDAYRRLGVMCVAVEALHLSVDFMKDLLPVTPRIVDAPIEGPNDPGYTVVDAREAVADANPVLAQALPPGPVTGFIVGEDPIEFVPPVRSYPMGIVNLTGGVHVIYRHGTFGWYHEYLTERRYRHSVSPEAGWYLSESDWIIPGTLQ